MAKNLSPRLLFGWCPRMLTRSRPPAPPRSCRSGSWRRTEPGWLKREVNHFLASKNSTILWTVSADFSRLRIGKERTIEHISGHLYFRTVQVKNLLDIFFVHERWSKRALPKGFLLKYTNRLGKEKERISFLICPKGRRRRENRPFRTYH